MSLPFTNRVERPVPGFLLLLVMFVSVATAGELLSDDERNFVDWAAERAIRFETLDWRQVDSAHLSVLDEALDGKRFVYLGESDHFMDEKNDFRMILIRYLATTGFRAIGPALLLRLHSGDPRESYLTATRTVRFMTYPGSAVLSKETDAIFFVSEVHECLMRSESVSTGR